MIASRIGYYEIMLMIQSEGKSFTDSHAETSLHGASVFHKQSAATQFEVVPQAQASRKCSHFAIRGYVAEVRKHDWKACWPFILPADNFKQTEYLNLLPPLVVPEFRTWTCQNCVDKITADSDKDLMQNPGVRNTSSPAFPNGNDLTMNDSLPMDHNGPSKVQQQNAPGQNENYFRSDKREMHEKVMQLLEDEIQCIGSITDSRSIKTSSVLNELSGTEPEGHTTEECTIKAHSEEMKSFDLNIPTQDSYPSGSSVDLDPSCRISGVSGAPSKENQTMPAKENCFDQRSCDKVHDTNSTFIPSSMPKPAEADDNEALKRPHTQCPGSSHQINLMTDTKGKNVEMNFIDQSNFDKTAMQSKDSEYPHDAVAGSDTDCLATQRCNSRKMRKMRFLTDILRSKQSFTEKFYQAQSGPEIEIHKSICEENVCPSITKDKIVNEGLQCIGTHEERKEKTQLFSSDLDTSNQQTSPAYVKGRNKCRKGIIPGPSKQLYMVPNVCSTMPNMGHTHMVKIGKDGTKRKKKGHPEMTALKESKAMGKCKDISSHDHQKKSVNHVPMWHVPRKDNVAKIVETVDNGASVDDFPMDIVELLAQNQLERLQSDDSTIWRNGRNMVPHGLQGITSNHSDKTVLDSSHASRCYDAFDIQYHATESSCAPNGSVPQPSPYSKIRKQRTPTIFGRAFGKKTPHLHYLKDDYMTKMSSQKSHQREDHSDIGFRKACPISDHNSANKVGKNIHRHDQCCLNHMEREHPQIPRWKQNNSYECESKRFKAHALHDAKVCRNNNAMMADNTDLYANEAISAMFLLKLMDEGASAHTPITLMECPRCSCCGSHRKWATDTEEMLRSREETIHSTNSVQHAQQMPWFKNQSSLFPTMMEFRNSGTPTEMQNCFTNHGKPAENEKVSMGHPSFLCPRPQAVWSCAEQPPYGMSHPAAGELKAAGELANWKMQARSQVDKFPLAKNSCATGICTLNRNPAEFTIPGPRNRYMIGGDGPRKRKKTQLDKNADDFKLLKRPKLPAIKRTSFVNP